MRLYSREDFWHELERRGCWRVSEEDGLTGTYWLGPDGRHFQIPAGDVFPEFMLDDVIRQHGLPASPKPLN